MIRETSLELLEFCVSVESGTRLAVRSNARYNANAAVRCRELRAAMKSERVMITMVSVF